MIILNDGIYWCDECGKETVSAAEFVCDTKVCPVCLKAALDALGEPPTHG